MEATLPPIATGKRLGYRHFPTTQQLFIYRNWDMVSPQTMARVLKTDAQTVSAMAADMGLPEPTGDDETWREKGYITIIRANWHLLTYAQICELLGWHRWCPVMPRSGTNPLTTIFTQDICCLKNA